MNLWQNYSKTAILLASLTALLMFVGYLFGGAEAIFPFFLLGVGMNFFAFFFSDQIALKSSGAKEVARNDAPKLYRMVEELSAQMNIPTPKIYVTPQQQANAFATGRSPSKSAVAFTEGILKSLSPDELRGVVAHELAHIKNRDTLIATIAAVLAGTISFIPRVFLFGGSRREGNGLGELLLLIVTPIVALILQLAISRSREYEADKTGALAMGSGRPLADALRKIHQSTKEVSAEVNPSFAPLYIANPLSRRSLSSLFSTHPPMEERVRRLEKMSI